MSLIEDDAKLFGFDSDAWVQQLARARAVEVLGSIGAYDLIAEAGRGGQGVVFRARQPGTGREVAVKRLLAGALASPDASRRFEREVELASALNHAGIVTVYGVEIVDGAPLLAMEWIDGVPATKWARGRSRDELLRLFLLVCDAVQHAHQRGVLHRDLKPSNVLVDASDRPHVLDFGLAKLVSESRASITASGQFLGTPAYAAPEQWRGDDLDARADVYSLGALLFEMLTARPVIEGEGLDAVARAAARREPPRPSSVVRSIPRDLDAIVLQALAIEPPERYQSVDALSADVQRFLAGEPVLAHSPGTWYVLRKLVARNRAVSALVLVLIAATLAYAVTTARQADRLTEQRDRAVLAGEAESRARADAESEKRRAEEARASSDAARAEADRERERALAEKASAEAVLQFVADDLMAAADPALLGRQPTLLEVLRGGAPKVEERFAASPLVASRVRSMLARAYYSLGSYREAETQTRQALEGLRNDPAATPYELAREEATLGSTLVELGEYAEAESLLRGTIRYLEDAQPIDEAAITETLASLAYSLLQSLRAPEALPVATRALELAPTEGHRVTARHLLATIHGRLGMHEKAIAEFEQLVQEPRVHENPAELSRTLHGLADAYEISGDLQRAESSFRRALDVSATVYGDHPWPANCMTRLAQVLARRGQNLDEAEQLARDAVEVVRSSGEGKWVFESVFYLGVILRQRGKTSEAEPLLTEAMELIERYYGRQHPSWSGCVDQLFMIYRQRGELARAERLLEEVAPFVSGSAQGVLLHDRALLRQRSGDLDGAAKFFEEAISVLASDPTQRKTLAAALRDYAGLLRELGNSAGATELELEAAELSK